MGCQTYVNVIVSSIFLSMSLCHQLSYKNTRVFYHCNPTPFCHFIFYFFSFHFLIFFRFCCFIAIGHGIYDICSHYERIFFNPYIPCMLRKRMNWMDDMYMTFIWQIDDTLILTWVIGVHDLPCHCTPISLFVFFSPPYFFNFFFFLT